MPVKVATASSDKPAIAEEILSVQMNGPDKVVIKVAAMRFEVNVRDLVDSIRQIRIEIGESAYRGNEDDE
jgi:hypothetical protein